MNKMKVSGSKLLAMGLIIIGVLMIFGKVESWLGYNWHAVGLQNGFHLTGWFIGWLIPIALAVFGYMGVRKGGTFFSWAFFLLGTAILAGKIISGLFVVALAAGLIVYGASKLMPGKNR
jgi:hypothetical protein